MSDRRCFTIIDAIDDDKLFASWFKDRATWASWYTFLRVLFGLPLLPRELALYQQCTGRTEPPTTPANEGWLICGRGSGKSFALALCAVYLAAFHSYRQYLAPGERGVVLVVASDRKQARVIFRYIRALLLTVPMLRKLVERETADAFDLNNSTSIEIMAASYRSLRGYTVISALLDELAFWPTDDAAEPDLEIINAIRPAMSTIPNAMLLCASSPFAQRGALFAAFKQHYAGMATGCWCGRRRRRR
jgi:phage terminase large subunit-like protein